MSAPTSKDFVTAGHELLFRDEAVPPACDACGRPVATPTPTPSDAGPSNDSAREDSDAEPLVPPGSGLYVWARGEQVRHEEPPLCSDCAAALGLTALARWEIEEEEG
jgi:hypothetical protein